MRTKKKKGRDHPFKLMKPFFSQSGKSNAFLLATQATQNSLMFKNGAG